MPQKSLAIVIFLYLIYFTSHITGRPGMNLIPAGPSTDPTGVIESPTGGVPLVDTGWKAGLVERLLYQKRAIDLFEDPLLESDSKPENLLRSLQRSYSSDLFLFFLTLAWTVLILLSLYALRRGYWFFLPLVRMHMIPSILFLFLNLITSRRESLIFYGWTPTLSFEILFETALIFSGIQILVRGSLPVLKERLQQPFLNHLKRAVKPVNAESVKTTVIQLLFIVLFGILLSNFVLFPVFAMQIQFPGAFAFLIMIGLIALALFYSRSYIKVSRSQEVEAHALTGVAFLGYRFIKNSLFISALVGLIFIATGAILTISILNIDFLQTMNLLKRSGSF